MKNEPVAINEEVLALANKRKELILKVIGQLYKGRVGTLHFKNGCIYKVDYYTSYNYRKQTDEEKKKCSPFGDFEELKKELTRNIHDIYDKFNEENLSILEFLMHKMDNLWYLTDKDIMEKIKDDIQDIKNRCANYLLIMAIEESEK